MRVKHRIEGLLSAPSIGHIKTPECHLTTHSLNTGACLLCRPFIREVIDDDVRL
jgi:hypothetical protein